MAQISFRPNKAYPSIPTVGDTVESHSRAIEAIREAVQIHERRTKDVLESFVRVSELVDLGLISVDGSITGAVVEDGGDDIESTTHVHDTIYVRLDGVLSQLSDVSVVGAANYDLMYRSGAQWRHTEQLLQWNPTLQFLQLANNHSVNWLDSGGSSVELVIFDATGAAGGLLTDEYRSRQVTTLTTTSTTYVDVDAVNRSVDVSTLTDGADYFLYMDTAFSNSVSNTPTGNYVRLTEDGGTSTVTGSEGRIDEFGNTGFPWQFGYQKTISTVGSDVVLQYKQADGIGACRDITWRGFGLNVSSLPTGAYFYNESTSPSTSGVYPTFANTAASITVGAGNWLIFINGQYDGVTSSRKHHLGFNDGSTTYEVTTLDNINSTNSLVMGGMYILEGLTGPTTLTVSAAVEINTTTMDRAMISAFRIDSFAEGYVDTDYVQNTSIAASDNVLLTRNFTAATSGEFVAIGFCRESWVSSGASGEQRIEVDINAAGAVNVANSGKKETIVNSDTYCHAVFPMSRFTLTAGDSVAVEFIHVGAASAASDIVEGVGMAVIALATSDTVSNTLILGDPAFPTRIDGTLVGLDNGVGVNWKDAGGADIEFLNFAGSTPGGTPVVDPDIDSVVLLITAEAAAAGATSFTSDIGGHTFDSVVHPTIGTGVANISAAQAKFGSNSVYVFDEIGVSNNAGFDAATSTDFDFGSGDFTIEFHWRSPDASITSRDTIGMWDNGSLGWKFQMTAGGGTYITTMSISTNGTGNNLAYAKGYGWDGSDPGAVDTWYHIALSRVGNSMRMFVDGEQIDATTDVTGMTIFAGTSKFYVGCATLNGPNYELYLDNIRLTKGVGRYTANFTPPAAPYDGSYGTEAFTVGDPAKDTVIDGLTTTISSADTVIEGDVTHKANTITQLHGDHTGEVIGVAEALTLDVTSVTNRGTIVADSADEVSLKDDSDGTLRKTSLNSITDGGYF